MWPARSVASRTSFQQQGDTGHCSQPTDARTGRASYARNRRSTPLHRASPAAFSVISVVNSPELGRYQIRLDGEVAGFAAYEVEGPHIAFMHTEIDERFARRGLGLGLAAQALDDVRAEGATVLPYCPFIRSFIASHPAYVDLVPESERPSFGLTADDGPTIREEGI
jgi:uncharacterized protein